MAKTHVLPITEARERIFEIAEKVQRPSTYFMLTQRGRGKAVVMSLDEFESWRETLEVMRDFPNLAKDIAEAEADYKSGRYKEYKTVDELLAEEGGKTGLDRHSYALHGASQAKRRKGAQKNSR